MYAVLDIDVSYKKMYRFGMWSSSMSVEIWFPQTLWDSSCTPVTLLLYPQTKIFQRPAPDVSRTRTVRPSGIDPNNMQSFLGRAHGLLACLCRPGPACAFFFAQQGKKNFAHQLKKKHSLKWRPALRLQRIAVRQLTLFHFLGVRADVAREIAHRNWTLMLW